MYARVYIVDNACKLAQDAFLSCLRNDCSLRDVSTCVLVLILQNLDAINKPVFFCENVKRWMITVSVVFNVFQVRFLFEVVVSTDLYMLHVYLK